jgi:hypothetical protein
LKESSTSLACNVSLSDVASGSLSLSPSDAAAFFCDAVRALLLAFTRHISHVSTH